MSDEGITIEAPAPAVSPEELNALPVKDYIEVKNEMEHEKRHPEPEEPEDTANERPQHKRNGFEKRIAKLTRRSHESEARATAAEQRAAELEARLASNGAGRHPESQIAGESSERASTQRATTTTDPQREAARRRYPDFEQTIKSADNTFLSKELYAAIEKLPNKLDVIYHLQKNPDELLSLDRAPHKVAEFSRGLQEIHDSFAGRTERVNQLRLDHSQRIKAKLATLPDRDKIVAGLNAPMPGYIETAILEQPNSDDLVIHFGRNRGVYDELNRISPEAAAARIGRISSQLEMQQTSTRTRERVKPPEPISTVGGASARSGVPLDQMPPREFNRIRNAQEAARRRR